MVDSPTFTEARSRSASMTALNVATYLNATTQVRLQAGRNPHNRRIQRLQNMHADVNINYVYRYFQIRQNFQIISLQLPTPIGCFAKKTIRYHLECLNRLT